MAKNTNILNSLVEFRNLAPGWNFGQGVPSDPYAVRSSQLVMSVAENLKFDDIESFPGVNGEIQLCFYLNDDSLELIFETNGKVTVTLEQNAEFYFIAENIFAIKAIQILKDFKYNGCRDYTSSTSNITTAAKKGVSQVWLSVQPQTEFQLSTGSVQKTAAEAYASTFGITTRQSQATPLFSGTFPSKLSQRTVELCIA